MGDCNAEPLPHREGETAMIMEAATLPGLEIAPRPCTPRQLQVLELLANGCTLAQAAYRLGISLSTAKTHLNNARERMGGITRQQLLLKLALARVIQVNA